ncbi:MAG: ubiquinol-cytochrome c reductase iron-sulfur subunit [Thermoguttaceae bacterium]
MNATTKTDSVCTASASCSQRRSFLKTATAAGIGAVAVSPAVCGGVRLALAPLTVATSGAGTQQYPIASVENLTETPQRFDVIGDLHDAWITSPRQVIGSVFAFKEGDKYLAFSTVCPHAGCAISFGMRQNPQTGKDEPIFFCPCHSAHFARNGERLDQVSPRDLDELKTEVVDGKLCVTFARFLCGVAEKKQA